MTATVTLEYFLLLDIFRYQSLRSDIEGNEKLNEYIEKTKEFDKNLYR